jgi:hypothetical protein
LGRQGRAEHPNNPLCSDVFRLQREKNAHCPFPPSSELKKKKKNPKNQKNPGVCRKSSVPILHLLSKE